MKAFDKITKKMVIVLNRAAPERCVVIRHSDGGEQIQFRSLLIFK